MNQSSIIAFGLLVGFVFFVTMRGELPGYLGVLGLSQQGAGQLGANPGVGTAQTAQALGLGVINNVVQ